MPHHPAHEQSGPPAARQVAAPLVRFQPQQTVVFFGDSITAAQPGYSDVLAQVLDHAPRKLNLSLINAGVPGDTVRDLRRRLQADVLSHHPAWVFVFIGTNDLFANAPDFESNLDLLIAAISAAASRPILMTLSLVVEELDENVARQLKDFNNAIKAVAERHSLPLIDLQRTFRDLYDRAATYKQEVALTSDGIHPNSKGHALIARAIVLQLGLLNGGDE